MKNIHALLPFVVAVSAFFWIGYFSLLQVDPHHDGILFKPAIDVVHGERIYVDTYELYGALTTFIQATFLGVFGEYVIVMKFSGVLFYSLAIYILFRRWSVLFGTKTALAAFFVWLSCAYFYRFGFLAWSSVYALVFQALSISCVFSYLAHPHRKYLLFMLGVMAALTAWCRLPVGGFLAIALGCFLIVYGYVEQEHIKALAQSLLLFICGGLVTSAPFFLLFLHDHSLHDYWLQTFVLSSSFLTATSVGASSGTSIFGITRSLFPGVFDTHQFILWSIIPLTNLFLFAVTLWRIITHKARTIRHWQLLALGFICLASWLQYYPASDPDHWHWATTPMMATFVWVAGVSCMLFVDTVHRFTHIPKVCFYIIFTVIILFFGKNLLSMMISSAYTKMTQTYVTLDDPPFFKGMLLLPDEATHDKQVTMLIRAYLAHNPGGKCLNMSGDGLYSLFDACFVSIPPFYAYWDWVIQSAYPDRLVLFQRFVQDNRPLLLSTYPLTLPDYCQTFIDAKYPLYIGVPREKILEKKCKS